MKSLSKTETPIFLSVVCSLFPNAIFLTFILVHRGKIRKYEIVISFSDYQLLLVCKGILGAHEKHFL